MKRVRGAAAAGYRLLLHVGLSKTATTTLQHNVLLPWHTDGHINFLGRCAHGGVVYDRFNAVFDGIRERRLAAGEIAGLRPAVAALLDAERLNVISNERIGGGETLGVGAAVNAAAVLHNLAALFHRGDVTVLVCLRAPVDWLLAAYVEQYYWRLHSVSRYRTLDRFLRALLRDGAAGSPWLVCGFGAWLRAVRRCFHNVEVLLYEDLLHDRAAWFARLAACLDAEPTEVERLFSERRNAGVYTRAGKRSKPVTVRQRLLGVLPPRAVRAGHAMLTRVPALHRLYRAAAGMGWATEHRLPDAPLRARLQRLLGEQDGYLTQAFGVSRSKLVRYGYLHPDVDVTSQPAVRLT